MVQENFYFTFGTAETFPLHEKEYVKISAPNKEIAVKEFRRHHPDHTPGIVNCAFIYNEREWNMIGARYYLGIRPAEYFHIVDRVNNDAVPFQIEISVNIRDIVKQEINLTKKVIDMIENGEPAWQDVCDCVKVIASTNGVNLVNRCDLNTYLKVDNDNITLNSNYSTDSQMISLNIPCEFNLAQFLQDYHLDAGREDEEYEYE